MITIAEGVDPRWVRSVTTPDGTWHVLDNASVLEREPIGTLLCVHGNPTSSYLWRHVIAALSTGERPWRVIAMDQLNMGWSQRTGRRRLGQRLDDLGRLTDALEIEGPVVTLGHDWGGCISLGWAVNHRARLAGVSVLNTAVHQPPGSALPFLIAAARTPGVRRLVTATTPIFLRATLAIAHPQLPARVQAGYLDPYRGASRRGGIDEFVEDIPVDASHPSWPALQHIVEGLPSLRDLPALMLWGPRDPVFTDLYLRDLRSRLPQAKVHRFEKAGHMVAEDADVAGAVRQWLEDEVVPGILGSPSVTSPTTGPDTSAAEKLWAPLEQHEQDPTAVLVEPTGHGNAQTGSFRVTSWQQLAADVHRVATGLLATGVEPGDRVALLVPPGADLTVALYACVRIGAVAVIADAGLGLPGLHRAIRGSAVRHVIAIDRGLAASRALRWPGQRISVGVPSGSLRARVLGVTAALEDLARSAFSELPAAPAADDEAMVIFTSGSTGPAKGVVYTHRQLAGVRDALLSAYGLRPDDRFVAAFAPFALFGPALGVPSVVPDMDVTAPRTLTATALAQATRALDATVIFASPAALANVLATAHELGADDRAALAGVRLLLSAGAPVPADLLGQVQKLLPRAELHTPYGMTEALLLTDVDLPELLAAGAGDGVLVGRPLPGVEIRLHPLDLDDEFTDKADVTGEIVVRARHLKERYDQLWYTQRATATDDGWHRTGDVGHFDADGRLWVEGRLAHVLHPASGFVTPYGVEQRIQTLPGVERAALVGIGPSGTQQMVAVIEAPFSELGVAAPELAASVRSVAGVDLAAVLVIAALKTDIRHNSKIDRVAVGRWAARQLAGSLS
ncbi:alpha/beta fold hydrolase [Kineosporia succinea]|uniref:Acyl-coenzyme A synthetase/AMP-(Fatty) acid ligase/alpha-beta hydrolase superfamily lysophospholipase n=1 Tax=Kineosporia succinea TaxID=84632 RepID=A0ABT9NXA1_9ACTN|nr:alpha/beta fold hydrolase [Kineosporia succinea]MDP9825056.1 acyl-coenzyme A synthetase/AMP-(fatty) acid ligase/alpha-beta hydrolase superfamily lysophospholipase [Kineosporia succinea]